MAEPRNPSPDEDELSQQYLDLIAELRPRQRAFLQHYLNPQSPGYDNKTKSAELAGYAGEPGSGQLSLAGHRVAKNPKVQKVMAVVFERAGCTLELDAKVIFEAMTATRTQYLRGPDNTIVSTPPQPDHPTRLHGLEVKHRLLRTNSATLEHHSPAADSGAASSAQYGLCAICREALNKVAGLSPADRALLRDITKSDQELRRAENSQEKDGEKDGQSNPRGEDS